MKRNTAILACMASLSLAACASLPTGQVSGALKPGGFVFADAGADQGALRDLVAARLAPLGLKPAADNPQFIVYLGFSTLPAKSGLYKPAATAPQAPPTDWVVDPAHGEKLHLEVVVLERATGQTVYDGGATLTGRGRKGKDALPELVNVALGQMAKP